MRPFEIELEDGNKLKMNEYGELTFCWPAHQMCHGNALTDNDVRKLHHALAVSVAQMGAHWED